MRDRQPRLLAVLALLVLTTLGAAAASAPQVGWTPAATLALWLPIDEARGNRLRGA